MDEKELVWVSKDLAKKIKSLENSDNFVLEFIEESKKDLKANFDAIDDEIIQYKANMIKAREAFRIAKDEMLSANYEIWEKFDTDRKSLYGAANLLVEKLKPLKDELATISDLMNKIDKWGIQSFVESLDKIIYLINSDKKEILQFLINNYKKES